MKTIYTAFNGKNNSSKLVLDYMDCENKLYLKNSFITSTKQLVDEIKNNQYDLIISFGQAPINKDTVKIEAKATGKNNYKTSYDYIKLKELLRDKYKVIISKNAGKYLCNNLYYHGLQYIDENKLKTKMIFIHIPKIDNITNIKNLSRDLYFYK